jgi:hypothetical protein
VLAACLCPGYPRATSPCVHRVPAIAHVCETENVVCVRQRMRVRDRGARAGYQNVRLHGCVCVCARVCAYVHACVHAREWEPNWVSQRRTSCACACVCMRVHVCAHVHIFGNLGLAEDLEQDLMCMCVHVCAVVRVYMCACVRICGRLWRPGSRSVS